MLFKDHFCTEQAAYGTFEGSCDFSQSSWSTATSAPQSVCGSSEEASERGEMLSYSGAHVSVSRGGSAQSQTSSSSGPPQQWPTASVRAPQQQMTWQGGSGGIECGMFLDDALVDSIISTCFEMHQPSATQHYFSAATPPPAAIPSAQSQVQPVHCATFPARAPVPSEKPARQTHRAARESGNGTGSAHGLLSSGCAKQKRPRARARPWSVEEHRRFEEGLKLFGRDWEQCAAYVGTRRASLVRSHAQKHLIKLWKLGKPLPEKLAESGSGYTLSGKPLLPDSASAKSYLIKIPCPPPCHGSQ